MRNIIGRCVFLGLLLAAAPAAAAGTAPAQDVPPAENRYPPYTGVLPLCSDPDVLAEITWNFGKFLIGNDGIANDLSQAVRQLGTGKGKPYGLTPRELDIVEAIASGDSNRDVAGRLNISLQTVKHHLTSIFDKTGASSRLELALFAIRQGIVDPQ